MTQQRSSSNYSHADSDGFGSRSNHSSSGGNKVIILGDEMVGKTSIIKRRFMNKFSKVSQETIEVDFKEVEQLLTPN